MKVNYLIRLFLHASQYAKQSQKNGDKRSVGEIKKDMMSLYRKYGIKASEYLSKRMGTISDEERVLSIKQIVETREYYKQYAENRRFLAKYSSMEWEKSPKKRRQRMDAYIKQYHMGKHCYIQFGVSLISEHHHIGKLTIGDNVLFARDTDIDYTGDLEIGNGVSLAEGCKILTHDHDYFGLYDESELIPNATHRAHSTPLIIHDNVLIGARSIIMAGVTEIGENAMISAGSVVTKPVPANSIVAGNPAQIVGKISPKARIYFRHNE